MASEAERVPCRPMGFTVIITHNKFGDYTLKSANYAVQPLT